ncbi:MAG: aldo/keto reductase [Myxococcota bacterium]
MKEIRLQSGSAMPALGLGTWKSKPDEVYHAVRTAIEVGYRHIDCAAIYANEDEVGRALSDAFTAGDVDRQDMWITSKLWNDAHASEDVQPALEASLRRLRLERLDLYLMHWPVALKKGVALPRTPDDFHSLEERPLEATWEAMVALSERGMTREVGVSNFTATKIKRVRDATGVTPAVNQVELHPYLQQDALIAACHEMGIGVTAYSPLGSPDSAAMFRRQDDAPLVQHPTVVQLADRLGATPGQVLIAWALARDTSVIPKSVNPGRIAENWRAHDVALDEAALGALGALDHNRRMVDATFWYIGEAYSEETLWGD